MGDSQIKLVNFVRSGFVAMAVWNAHPARGVVGDLCKRSTAGDRIGPEDADKSIYRLVAVDLGGTASGSDGTVKVDE